MNTQPGPGTGVRDLSRAECEELLTRHTIGRVGFQSWDGPWVLPVSYLFWTRSIVFRTAVDGLLSRLGSRAKVAFEVDEFDAGGAACSVVVRGFTRQILNAHPQLQLLADPRLVPWAPGPRTMVIAIEPETISGRRLPAPASSPRAERG